MRREPRISNVPTDAASCWMYNRPSRTHEWNDIAQDESRYLCVPSAGGLRLVSVVADYLFKKSGESRDEGGGDSAYGDSTREPHSQHGRQPLALSSEGISG